MKKKLLKLIKVIGIPLVIFCSIYVLTIHLVISNTANKQPPDDLDYIVVLGARLHGETMSLALLYRVEAALKYLQENPNTYVIASGGQGPGETITEAEAMKRYFVKNGIAEERIIEEKRSTTTLENLSYSNEYISEGSSVGIVSNDFHLFRASFIAKRLGIHPYTIPAKTPTVAKPKSWSREYIAVIKSYLYDR
ncbi:YdcF family protein [Bacillus alkalisoli]|uniref:YdcF family protein n=1 Tax=Bacillus alkalisoli TaxID=2011008 RepID=UPI0012FF4FC7|nr:YdcF family protein [Bacillus alkalisoli]